MGLYAVIDNNIVTNIIICDADFAASMPNDLVLDVENLTDKPSIGSGYNGTIFSAPPSIISEVTPRQIRIALMLSGVSTADINTAIDGLPEPTKTIAKIEWEYSISFIRTNVLVSVVGQLLGWNDAQLDQLWITAAGL